MNLRRAGQTAGSVGRTKVAKSLFRGSRASVSSRTASIFNSALSRRLTPLKNSSSCRTSESVKISHISGCAFDKLRSSKILKFSIERRDHLWPRVANGCSDGGAMTQTKVWRMTRRFPSLLTLWYYSHTMNVPAHLLDRLFAARAMCFRTHHNLHESSLGNGDAQILGQPKSDILSTVCCQNLPESFVAIVVDTKLAVQSTCRIDQNRCLSSTL
jgi:hypothetical protein